MVDYNKYSEKTIRNREDLGPEEQALVEYQAEAEIKAIMDRFAKEPIFFKKHIAPKLSRELLGHLDI